MTVVRKVIHQVEKVWLVDGYASVLHHARQGAASGDKDFEASVLCFGSRAACKVTD